MLKLNNGDVKKVGHMYGRAVNIVSKNFIILGLIAFLLGRASILEGLMPFGIAFFSMMIIRDKRNTLLGAIVLLGVMTTDVEKYRYIIYVYNNIIIVYLKQKNLILYVCL